MWLLHVPQTPFWQAEGSRSPAARAAASTVMSGGQAMVRAEREKTTLKPSAAEVATACGSGSPPAKVKLSWR